MTTYTAPPAVSNLTSFWTVPTSNVQLESGITLNWTQPTVTSGTLGFYNVYIMLYNNNLKEVVEVPFLTLLRRAQKSTTMNNVYSIAEPVTSVFFPFSYTPPQGCSFPAPTTVINNTTVAASYSFHIYAGIVEAPDLLSPLAGVTAFQPRIDTQSQVVHFNPRFNIKTYPNNGFVDTFEQNTYNDVASCVEMVLSTPQGWRSALPDFGFEDPTFTQVNPNLIRASIKKWEPRASVDVSVINDDSVTSATGGGADNAIVNVNIVSINGTA